MSEENIIEITGDNTEEIEIGEDTAGKGTSNYNNLENKPKINNVELKDNKTSKQLGLQEEMDSLTNVEIEEILNSFVGG